MRTCSRFAREEPSRCDQVSFYALLRYEFLPLSHCNECLELRAMQETDCHRHGVRIQNGDYARPGRKACRQRAKDATQTTLALLGRADERLWMRSLGVAQCHVEREGTLPRLHSIDVYERSIAVWVQAQVDTFCGAVADARCLMRVEAVRKAWLGFAGTNALLFSARRDEHDRPHTPDLDTEGTEEGRG